MLTVLAATCAVLLLAVFLRLGRVVRAIDAIRAVATDRGAPVEPPATVEETSKSPMKELRGPSDLAQMRAYFRNTTGPHAWSAPDPEVARRFEDAAARRVVKD